jgi:heme oxygenase
VDISRLRLETAHDHQEVEDGMDLMSDDIDTFAYLRCLRRLYGIVAAWEDQALVAAPGWLVECVSLRQRRHLLDLDLEALGTVPTTERATLPSLDDPYLLLGAMYVMEGSTLGGQVIARHVQKRLGFEAGKGGAFFFGHGAQTGRMWKDFCYVLETSVPGNRGDSVVVGAKAMFACFRVWMLRSPAPIDS